MSNVSVQAVPAWGWWTDREEGSAGECTEGGGGATCLRSQHVNTPSVWAISTGPTHHVPTDIITRDLCDIVIYVNYFVRRQSARGNNKYYIPRVSSATFQSYQLKHF